MVEAGIFTYLTFAVYLLGMIAVGTIASRRTRNLPDYLLGGRSIGRWVTALSAEASDMSGWLLLGLPGYAYLSGYEAGWLALGLFVGTWCNWRWVAPRLRNLSGRQADTLTIPDFLARRVGGRTTGIRLVSAVFVLVFFTFYTSAGLVAGGRLFEAVFGLPYVWAVTAGAVVILSYTLAGGFLAVCWTDLVQGLMMFAALVVTGLVVTTDAGGIVGLHQQLESISPELVNPSTNARGQAMSMVSILSLLAWGLGYFGQPHILVRFMAIHSEAELKPARRIAVAWVFVCLLAAILVGVGGRVILEAPLEGAASEQVFMVLVTTLFHPLVAGILLAAILAAVMSTADSQLLVSSSALTEDFYRVWIRPHASEQELVRTGRAAVLVVGLVAYGLALEPGSKVLDLVAYAWAGFGAAFGPVILFSLYWRGISAAGAMAGILTGGICVILWKSASGGWFDLYELLPGFLLSSLAIVLVSYLRPDRGSAESAS